VSNVGRCRETVTEKGRGDKANRGFRRTMTNRAVGDQLCSCPPYTTHSSLRILSVCI